MANAATTSSSNTTPTIFKIFFTMFLNFYIIRVYI
jgi:hypothetical protein